MSKSSFFSFHFNGCQACNLAKCSSKNKAGDVDAAVVNTANGAAGVVGDEHGSGEKEVGNGALPCPSSLSLSSTLPLSPSSWLKVGRMPALLPTNLTKHVVIAGGGGGGGGGSTGAVPTSAAARDIVNC